MRRGKKLIIGVVLAVVLLAGSLGGVAFASDGEDEGGPADRFGEFMDRVCAIYQDKSGGDTIENPDALKEAFTEARGEMSPEGWSNRGERDPEALQNRLQELFNEGKITQEQFDKMKERIDSMPDGMPGFGFRGHGGFQGFGGQCAPAD